jgi:hypothetical protein
VEDVKTRHYPYQSRVVCTLDLRMRIHELMKVFFASSA